MSANKNAFRPSNISVIPTMGMVRFGFQQFFDSCSFQRVEFLRRQSIFDNLLEVFGSVFIFVLGFQAILIVLAVWARFVKREWCRNHAKV